MENDLTSDLYMDDVNLELSCQFLPCHMFVHHMVDSLSGLISGLHRIDVNSELSCQFLPCHNFLRRIVNSFSGADLISGLYWVDVNSAYYVSFSVATGFCITWSIRFQVQILFQVCRNITNKKSNHCSKSEVSQLKS